MWDEFIEKEGATLSKSLVSLDKAAAMEASGVLLVVRSRSPDFWHQNYLKGVTKSSDIRHQISIKKR